MYLAKNKSPISNDSQYLHIDLKKLNCREGVEIPDPEVAPLSLVTLDHWADGHCLIDTGHHPDIIIHGIVKWIDIICIDEC